MAGFRRLVDEHRRTMLSTQLSFATHLGGEFDSRDGFLQQTYPQVLDCPKGVLLDSAYPACTHLLPVAREGSQALGCPSKADGS